MSFSNFPPSSDFKSFIRSCIIYTVNKKLLVEMSLKCICHTLPNSSLYDWMMSWRWKLVLAVKTSMMAPSSVPKPFIASRNNLASSAGTKFGYGTTVGSCKIIMHTIHDIWMNFDRLSKFSKYGFENKIHSPSNKKEFLVLQSSLLEMSFAIRF